MNDMKSEHVYICDCQMLVHICSNGAFPAPKHPLGHTGDLDICARIGEYQRVRGRPSENGLDPCDENASIVELHSREIELIQQQLQIQ